MFKYELGFLGYGNMAKAILSGLVKKYFPLDKLIVYSPSIANRDMIDGIKVAKSPEELFALAENVCLAVKPQIFKSEIIPIMQNIENKIVISIMAGIAPDLINVSIGNKDVKVCRVMPNTPATVGEGVTLVLKDNALDESVYEYVYSIFKTIGKTVLVDEKNFDVASALTGSGPALVEYFVHSMIAFGIDSGLSYKDSRKMVLQTFKGSIDLINHSKNEFIEDMIQKVCSKGGMTIQAINYLESKDVDVIIRKSLKAAKEKAEELGNR